MLCIRAPLRNPSRAHPFRTVRAGARHSGRLDGREVGCRERPGQLLCAGGWCGGVGRLGGVSRPVRWVESCGTAGGVVRDGGSVSARGLVRATSCGPGETLQWCRGRAWHVAFSAPGGAKVHSRGSQRSALRTFSPLSGGNPPCGGSEPHDCDVSATPEGCRRGTRGPTADPFRVADSRYRLRSLSSGGGLGGAGCTCYARASVNQSGLGQVSARPRT